MDAQAVLDELRRIGVETARAKVKAAAGGCPTSVRETLSAFANTNGGTVLLGVDDTSLQPVDIDAPRIRDALAGMAANDMTPPVRGEISGEGTPVLAAGGGERFTDYQTVDGSLAEMVERALEILVRHMSRASVVEAHGRTDRLEYPLGVVRELLGNAVMHRDYSPGARGTQVQVELFPDRLVVRSPGGFYGPVDPTRFGQPDVSSSRNTVLARLLS